MALPLAAIAITESAVTTGLALLVSMYAGVLWNVVTVSFRQRVIPDALLGRVNSIYRFFGWGMMPLGALGGGIIVAWTETGLGREAALRLVFWIGAFGFSGLLLYALAKLQLPDSETPMPNQNP